VIKDDDQRIVELEAMKTSVWVTPGDDTVGKKILSFAVKEGDAVTPGQTLLYIEE
jgi:biotin carboxyl carrier protein